MEPIQRKPFVSQQRNEAISQSTPTKPEDIQLPETLPNTSQKKDLNRHVASFLLEMADEDPAIAHVLPYEVYKELIQVYVDGVLECFQKKS